MTQVACGGGAGSVYYRLHWQLHGRIVPPVLDDLGVYEDVTYPGCSR